jgi:3-oxoadipate enol-lactonase
MARPAPIAAQTLVLAGAEDLATTPDDPRFLARGIPAARLVVIDGAAHLANAERPIEFTASVIEHLEKGEDNR